jgi:hypothetical protein
MGRIWGFLNAMAGLLLMLLCLMLFVVDRDDKDTRDAGVRL